MTIDHTNILIELNRAVKTLNFYPKGHPNLEQVLGGFLTLLKEATSGQKDITLRIDSKSIVEDGKPIAPNNVAISALAKQLFLKKIKVLNINSRISAKDIDGFLSLLAMEPQAVFKDGGAVIVLAKLGVTGILLNETGYEQLKELQEKLEDERAGKEEDDDVEQADTDETADAPSESEPNKETETEKPEEEKESTLKELLRKMADEQGAVNSIFF